MCGSRISRAVYALVIVLARQLYFIAIPLDSSLSINAQARLRVPSVWPGSGSGCSCQRPTLNSTAQIQYIPREQYALLMSIHALSSTRCLKSPHADFLSTEAGQKQRAAPSRSSPAPRFCSSPNLTRAHTHAHTHAHAHALAPAPPPISLTLTLTLTLSLTLSLSRCPLNTDPRSLPTRPSRPPGLSPKFRFRLPSRPPSNPATSPLARH